MRLQVTVDIGLILEADAAGKYADTNRDYLSFWIVNIGETEAMVTTIGWMGRPKLVRKSFATQYLGVGQYEQLQKLPARMRSRSRTFLGGWPLGPEPACRKNAVDRVAFHIPMMRA